MFQTMSDKCPKDLPNEDYSMHVRTGLNSMAMDIMHLERYLGELHELIEVKTDFSSDLKNIKKLFFDFHDTMTLWLRQFPTSSEWVSMTTLSAELATLFSYLDEQLKPLAEKYEGDL